MIYTTSTSANKTLCLPASDTAENYLRDNFQPCDRLAVVLLDKRTEAVVQRIARADKIAAPNFQRFLRYMNAHHYEVYITMNTLQEAAKGRTRADVCEIRHVYLDFDEEGDAAIERLLHRSDLPSPNYLLSSSPGKWQAIWKVEQFEKGQAEELQRRLARDTGADIATTDCARVLRLPGFNNHKYAQPHWVTAQKLSEAVACPEHFPQLSSLATRQPNRTCSTTKQMLASLTYKKSQSERDWAYARRALLRGDSPEAVITAMARFRSDKPDPHYYAELTVRKAALSLQEFRQVPTATGTPNR